MLNLLSKNTIYERTTLYHSAIAEARALVIVTHKKVEKCLLVRHNQSVHVVTFRASGRPRYVTSKQELPVFRAITAFRCESDGSESDLTPMRGRLSLEPVVDL